MSTDGCAIGENYIATAARLSINCSRRKTLANPDFRHIGKFTTVLAAMTTQVEET